MLTISSIFARPPRSSLPWGLWMVGFSAACICGVASCLALGVTVLFADSPTVNWPRIWLSLWLRCIHFGLLVGMAFVRRNTYVGAGILFAVIVTILAMFHWPDNLLPTPLELLPLAFIALGTVFHLVRKKNVYQSSDSLSPVLTDVPGRKTRKP
jgi:hypothetical protein